MPARRAQPEAQIQRAVIEHLKIRGAKNLFYFHPFNGGYRKPIEAAIAKGLGVKSGVPDLILLHDGKFYGLEIKVEKGSYPTEPQLQAIGAINEAGGFACIAYGFDRAIACLEQWGLLRFAGQHHT